MVSVQRNDQIPQEFQSSIVRAKGYASFNEILNISPANTFNSTLTNEVIKFQFKTPDYIDPYDIYFDVQIESIAPVQFTHKSHRLYLDGSSSQLFQEIQIFSRSRHLETIRQHDQVMNIIESVGFDPDNAASQSYLGYQINNPQGGSVRQPSNAANFNLSWQASPNYAGSNYGAFLNGPLGYLPQKSLPQRRFTTSSGIFAANPSGLLSWQSHANTTPGQNSNVWGSTQKHACPYFPNDLANIGPLSNVRSTINTYSANLASQFDACLKGTRCEIGETLDGSLGVQGLGKPFLYENDTDTTNQINTLSDFTYADIGSADGFYQKTQNLGFQSYWSQSTAEGNKCQWLDYGYGQTWIANGQIQNQPIASNILRLQVPLNSGVFGTLLPESKMIPGKALGDTEIQVRLNPYAFFASGLARDADIADGGKGQIDLSAYQIPRAWKIKDIQLVIHTYSFDPTFTQQLENQLAQGITLRSNGFDFAQSSSVPDSRFLQGSWPIITGIQSLKALYIYFQDEAYLTKTFCRRNFNLSGNVTSIQLKINADYYPRRPIQGHAGNPIINSLSQFDNSEFIVWYQKQLGLFNTRSYTSINRVNFAINSRSYDTSTEATTIYGTGYPKYKDHLLAGLPGQEEQRYRGRALYPFSFVQKPQMMNVLQGIDVSNVRPLEILIKTDQINFFNGPLTLMILQHFNIEVQFSTTGVSVYGYA